jgi:ABC-2 type transport system permease protein
MNTQILRDAWFIARFGTRQLLRAREVLVWTFLMPPVFFYFIGMVNGDGPAETKDTLAVQTAPDAGFLADELIARLGARDYRIVRPASREEFLGYRRRLEIPAGFTASVLAAHPVKVSFSRKGQDMSADYDNVRLSRAVYSVLADLIAVKRDGGPVTPESFQRLAAEPRTLTLDVKAAGKRLVPPSHYEQSVPGIMVMFTMTVLFTAGAVTITTERTQGLLRRLASAPISRGAVVLGKWGSRMIVGVVQILFAMLCGTVLFHVNWGPNLPAVIAVMLAYGAMIAVLALLLGNFGGTESRVIATGVIASNAMAGLGGCWWPIEITPLWTQHLAMFFPTGWAMDALHKLMSFGASPAAVVPHIALMLAVALAGGWVLARKFRFQ